MKFHLGLAVASLLFSTSSLALPQPIDSELIVSDHADAPIYMRAAEVYADFDKIKDLWKRKGGGGGGGKGGGSSSGGSSSSGSSSSGSSSSGSSSSRYGGSLSIRGRGAHLQGLVERSCQREEAMLALHHTSLIGRLSRYHGSNSGGDRSLLGRHI